MHRHYTATESFCVTNGVYLRAAHVGSSYSEEASLSCRHSAAAFSMATRPLPKPPKVSTSSGTGHDAVLQRALVVARLRLDVAGAGAPVEHAVALAPALAPAQHHLAAPLAGVPKPTYAPRSAVSAGVKPIGSKTFRSNAVSCPSVSSVRSGRCRHHDRCACSSRPGARSCCRQTLRRGHTAR